MLSSRQPKKNLSKNLLQMKFMQKCKEDYLKEEEEKQYNLKLTEEHWFIESPLDENFRDAADSVPSFIVCEDLLTIGRMSFKNFNPAVDKIFAEMLRKREMKLRGIKDDEQDVSDEEMAKRYESLIDTVGKKFSKKRKGKRKAASSDSSSEEELMQTNAKKHKSMFMKPKVD